MVMFPSYVNVMIIEGHQTLGDTLSQNMAAGKKNRTCDMLNIGVACGASKVRSKHGMSKLR